MVDQKVQLHELKLQSHFLIEQRYNAEFGKYFEWAVNKRPRVELFNIQNDPSCIENLANNPEYLEIKEDLLQKMETFLKKTGDPRFVGEDPDIFETYKRYSPIRDFPEPDWVN